MSGVAVVWLLGSLTSLVLLVARLPQSPLCSGWPTEPSEATPRVDAQGDPLPAGALLRLGSSRLRHPSSIIASLGFSPDGKVLISAGSDAVRLWDVATGKASLPLPTEGQTCALLLPDGRTFAVGDVSHVQLWDSDGCPLRKMVDKGERGASVLAASPDGKTLAAGNDRGDVLLWQVESGELLAELRGGRWEVSGLAFSPDGKALAACDGWRGGEEAEVNTVSLWEPPVPRPKWQVNISGGVNSVSFFPDGKTLAVGVRTGPVRYLSAATGERAETPELEGSPLTVSATGKLIALAGPDRTVRLCDPVTGQERRGLTGHGSSVSRLAFSPDGKVLASGDTGGLILLWDTETGRELHPLPGHRARVGAVAISPDGRSLVSRGGDQTIRCWDLATGKETLRLDAGSERDWYAQAHPGIRLTTSLAYSADGGLVATWETGRRSILVWDVHGKDKPRVLRGHEFGVTCVAFSPDSRTLASADQGGEVRLWDGATGELLQTVIKPQGRQPATDSVVVFAEDGRRLGVYSPRGVDVWDLIDKRSVFINRDWANSLLFSRDGEWLALAQAESEPGTAAVRLVGARTGDEFRTLSWPSKGFGSGRGLLTMALSPDGRFLAVTDGRQHYSAAHADWDLRVWDLLTGKQCHRFQGHHGSINGVAFSPDGKRLATAGEDGTILVWDLLSLSEVTEERLRTGLDDAGVEQLWTDLAAEDPREALKAMKILAHVPAKALAVIRSRVKPVPNGGMKEVAELVVDLSSDEAEVRASAFRRLEAFGHLVAPGLQRALAQEKAAQANEQLRDLLDRAKTGLLSPEIRREERVLALLEWIDSREAREILRGLSEGDPKARLTRQAGAELARLEHRQSER